MKISASDPGSIVYRSLLVPLYGMLCNKFPFYLVYTGTIAAFFQSLGTPLFNHIVC